MQTPETYEYKRKTERRENSREQRLREQIQNTLKSLSNRVDQSVEQNQRTRPEKPNKFWFNSIQNQSKKMLPKDIKDHHEPRATDFPDIDDFLQQSPIDSELFELTPTPDAGKRN